MLKKDNTYSKPIISGEKGVKMQLKSCSSLESIPGLVMIMQR